MADGIYLPSEWSDEQKMNALYSPLPALSVNPEGYFSKIAFWKKAINTYCKSSKKSSFSQDDIMNAFARKNKKSPHCLLTVIDLLNKEKEFILVDQFLAMKPDFKNDWEWSKLAWDLVRVPIYFTLNKLQNALWSSCPPQPLYVHMESLKMKANKILQCAKPKEDVILLSELLQNSHEEISIEDAVLALHLLFLERKVAIKLMEENTLVKASDKQMLNLMTSPSKVLVKIANMHNSEVSITDVDVAKYKLSKVINQTELKIAEYEKKAEDATKQAIYHLKKGSRAMAKLQLTHKRRYLKNIEEEATKLNNLYGLLETFNKTQSNIEVADTLKTANAVIKNVLKESNVNLDSVEDLMDDVRDTIDIDGEISSALCQSVSGDNTNEDLEKELKELQEDLSAEDNLCKWVDKLKLPDLPAEPQLVQPAVPVPDAPGHN